MKRAFTLLEVLLAIGLVGALSGGVFAFMFQIAAQKSALTSRAMDGQAGDAILERVESDLAVAVASDSAGIAGISGSATSLRVLSRGLGLPMKDGDRVWAAGDLQGTEYSFANGTLSARRWDAHRNRAGPTGATETVSRHLAAFRIRYYDGQAWVDSFDSTGADGLPVAVEVSLWFGVPEAAGDIAPRSTPVREVSMDPGDGPSEPPGDIEPAPDPVVEQVWPTRKPDRMRVMVVPDGPTTAWKELR